ncbi:MAG: iron-containing redox enzyme family protein [Nocardioidaceae bacterium]
MRCPAARGDLGSMLRSALLGRTELETSPFAEIAAAVPDDRLLSDDDAQLTLWTLYELHYRGFSDVSADREWDPSLLAARRVLETAFERALRARTGTVVTRALAAPGTLAERVFAMVAADDGPALAAYLHRRATREQVVEFLRERSVFHLKESDPQTFVLARLDGPAKTALAELLYDEFGGGRPERLHATMFADTLRAAGLDARYGTYVEEVDATTLAVNNAMSLFGLHRRLRGAAMGHLAAFEATSSVPSRKIAAGLRRVGLPEAAALYFDEHVEADSVHEQLAVRSICESLVAADPALERDVLFGVATCLDLDALAGAVQLSRWQDAPAVAVAS